MPRSGPAPARVTYVGHGTVALGLGDRNILTDPFLRSWLGPIRRHGRRPDPDLVARTQLVLISHVDRDHLDLRSLRRLPDSAELVAPRGAGRVAARGGLRHVHELGPGESATVAGVRVNAVKAKHRPHRHPFSRLATPALGYVIEAGGRRVYFAGDTDLFEGMAELGPVDLALLPVGGFGPRVGAGHLNPRKAARAAALIAPRVVVPIHWGTLYPVGLEWVRPRRLEAPARELERIAADVAPDVSVRVLLPGAWTDLD